MGSLEAAVMETVVYATKAPEFEEVETAARFAKSMKGKRLVQPFGTLGGGTTWGSSTSGGRRWGRYMTGRVRGTTRRARRRDWRGGAR
jgi:hypothetical protein